MKARYLIAAASAAVLVSSAAPAGDPAYADKTCSTLQTQFDKDVTTAAAGNVGQAQSLRDEGARLCSEGKSTEGVSKLKEAISLLGNQPPKS